MTEQAAKKIRTGDAVLDGDLVIPEGAVGLVVFVHGSGSSRFSERNRFVAGQLNGGRLATLLMDLLTAGEEQTDRYSGEYRFDIGLLSRRVAGTLDWLTDQPDLAGLPLGLFGSSTGAAAALNAAAARPERVVAVVSRGGRPDLASAALNKVQAPTLLIVGGLDGVVIDLNRQAAERLCAAKHELAIVPGATHLFEEPGKLEQVAELARDWFVRHLGGNASD